MSRQLVSNIPQIKSVITVNDKLAACRSIVDDLKDIYSDKFLCDINLKTKTNSFPAHKTVLCARSPVFKLMFSNDMREKNSDSIQVDDLKDETVQQLLLFLYSDMLEDLEWETATKLYYAADKYQIEKLKLLCSSFLIENLTAPKTAELLVLADAHSDSDLRRGVEDFILNHEELVFCSDEWEKLMETSPQLALQAMHCKYKMTKQLLAEPPNQRQNVVQVDERPINCFWCDKPFPNPEVYEKHLVHLHMVFVEKKNVRDWPGDVIRTYKQGNVPTQEELVDISYDTLTDFYCEICVCNPGPTYREYYLHMMNHGAEKRFQCCHDNCFKTFSSPSMFEQHIQTHLPNWEYSCKQCNVAFISQEKLSKHNLANHPVLQASQCRIAAYHNFMN